MKVKEFLHLLEAGIKTKIIVWKIIDKYDSEKTEYIARKNHKTYKSHEDDNVSVHISDMSDIDNFITIETMLDMELDSKTKIGTDYYYDDVEEQEFLKIELYMENKN